MTAGLRDLPDFLVIGAKRGGTTSLWRYLSQHPDVLPLNPSNRVFPMREARKGTYWLDKEHHRSEAWYRSHFATRPWRRTLEVTRRRPTVTGEASPYYLHHPLAAERAARVFDDVRLVAVVRDPVARAHSHWKERRRAGAEPLDLVDALRAEPTRTAGAVSALVGGRQRRVLAHEDWSYVEQGRYLPALDRWRAAFGRESMLVLPSEDLYADPHATVRTVTRWLGLEDEPLDDVRPWNATRPGSVPDAAREIVAARLGDDNRRLAEQYDLDLRWA